MNAVLLKHSTRDYPGVVLDITTDDSPLDLVAGRFGAGIHLGEFIERDMIATRVSRDQRVANVASPRYFRVASETQVSARSTG